MTRIGLLSDTHSYLDPNIFRHFENVDEIWHAGDFGSIELVDKLAHFKPLRGVWGNVDDAQIRLNFPESNAFSIDGLKVLMIHIGGFPGRYSARAKSEILHYKPELFISGHSHILKIMFDQKLQCLHMNPGAAGRHGWHLIRTLIRFEIDAGQIQKCEVIELGKRSSA